VLNHTSPADTLVVAGQGASAEAKRRIARKGVQVIEVETREGRVDMGALADRLGLMGVASILVEGGSRVLASAFKAGIVDKVCFFYAPLILGGDDGFPVCRGAGAERIKDAIRLERIRTRCFGDDVMIEGYVVGAQS
jgi:diaminohydroxyphosphoribosylaminopyrimidine deaminase/5-amino-6-(5-phosphoribosylamino)uracil reductase